METLFQVHREAEARRDYDAVLETFTEDCYLETVPLGLRSEGRAAARAAYVGYFTAFPDLAPDDEGDGLRRRRHGHLGPPERHRAAANGSACRPTGRSFRVPFTNITTFTDGRMAGESIYFDLATLCEQAGSPSTPSAQPPRRESQPRPRLPESAARQSSHSVTGPRPHS